MNKNRKLGLFVSVTAITAFAAGFVTAADHTDGRIVNAFAAVGKNIFGDAFFGASVIAPPDDITPATVQIDLAGANPPDDSHPVLFNVFDPAGASCVAQLQIAVTSDGVSVYTEDTNAVGIHFQPLGQPPDPCRNDNVIDPGPG